MKDLKQNLLRYHERQELQSEIDSMDQTLAYAKPDDKPVILQRKERARKQLAHGSPEPLTGLEKDKLSKLEKRLREKIVENMPPEEVMRKNPVGAIDWHQKWEKVNKPLILMWKNCRIQLNPESSDKDLANIERYRPSGQLDRMRTDAQISGIMSYGNVPDENWPFDAPQNTAALQAKRVYDAEQAGQDVDSALAQLGAEEVKEVITDGFGPNKSMTAVEYANRESQLVYAREVLAKKRAEKKQLEESLQSVPESFSEAEAAD